MGVETMPFKHQLTWMPHARRWRKRYQGRTYCLKSPCRGKKDRAAYLNALAEWERLKCFLDRFGPSPYTDLYGILRIEGQRENDRGIRFTGRIKVRVPVAGPQRGEFVAAATLNGCQLDDLVVLESTVAVTATLNGSASKARLALAAQP